MTTSQTAAVQLGFDFTTPIPTPVPEAPELSPREQRLAEAHATLAAGLAGVREDPASLAAFLAFSARFRTYSARNQMLVFVQRPTARFCKGFRAWQAEGRQVRKGERGIKILAPCLRRPTADEIAGGADPDRRVVYGYRTTTTFDYEQTGATGDDALVYTPPATRLDADGPEGLLARLEAVAQTLGYTVTYTEPGYADGRCRFADRVIEVRPQLSGADRASVLAHELAHAVAHDPSNRTEDVTKASMELQAEGAAFVALAALGLDTGRASLPYLKSWAGDDALSTELTAIDRIAGRLLALIDATC